MQEVIETNLLEMLEENFEAAKQEIRELDQQCWIAMKSLDHKSCSPGEFDPIRYKERKRKLLDFLPVLQSRLLKERIRVLQSRRPEIQRELDAIQPAQLKTKALVMRAQEILESAWQEHAKLDLKAAALEGELGINFDDTRAAQRELQGVISEIIDADLDHDQGDGLPANEQK